MARRVVELVASAFLLWMPTAVFAQDQTSSDSVSVGVPAISNFSIVGFPIDLTDDAAFNAFIDELSANCELIELDEDDRLCVSENANGGQFWIGYHESEAGLELKTINPAFTGESRFPVIAIGTASDPVWEPFEYRLSASFGEHEIPLLVELADPRQAARFQAGSPQQAITLDLTAFTFRPSIFKSGKEFEIDQLERGVQNLFATNFFIPTGLFGDAPSARARFAGEVKQARKWTGVDGRDYWIVLAEVLGGATVNVVFAASATEVKPKRGNLIVGDFWLSAHVLTE